jgi:hypothetical protein
MYKFELEVVRWVSWELQLWAGAGSWGRAEFRDLEEEGRPPLETATKLLPGKT